ncbi:hypothetical protein D3C72_2426110 [compost metagenome]
MSFIQHMVEAQQQVVHLVPSEVSLQAYLDFFVLHDFQRQIFQRRAEQPRKIVAAVLFA